MQTQREEVYSINAWRGRGIKRTASPDLPVGDASFYRPSSVTRSMSSLSFKKSLFQLTNCTVRAAPGNPSKDRPLLIVDEVSKCSPIHVGFNRDTSNGTIYCRPHLRKRKLSQSAHLEKAPHFTAFTDKLVTGQWRLQSCSFSRHNSWRLNEPFASTGGCPQLEPSRLLLNISYSSLPIYEDLAHAS
jgi:hypothetical protein